jgi:hypothetical protein
MDGSNQIRVGAAGEATVAGLLERHEFLLEFEGGGERGIKIAGFVL